MSKATDTDLLPMSKLANMKENKTSKRERKKQQIINYAHTRLAARTDLAPSNPATITDVYQIVENAVRKKDQIDKIDVVLMVLSRLFPVPLTDKERDLVKNLVQHMMDNKTVKKVTMYCEIYSYMKKVVINNLLFRSEHSS